MFLTTSWTIPWFLCCLVAPDFLRLVERYHSCFWTEPRCGPTHDEHFCPRIQWRFPCFQESNGFDCNAKQTIPCQTHMSHTTPFQNRTCSSHPARFRLSPALRPSDPSDGASGSSSVPDLGPGHHLKTKHFQRCTALDHRNHQKKHRLVRREKIFRARLVGLGAPTL